MSLLSLEDLIGRVTWLESQLPESTILDLMNLYQVDYYANEQSRLLTYHQALEEEFIKQYGGNV